MNPIRFVSCKVDMEEVIQKYKTVAVSTGFDRHERDWGGLLTTENYETIGKVIRDCAERVCNGRRYAVLEGDITIGVWGKTRNPCF